MWTAASTNTALEGGVADLRLPRQGTGAEALASMHRSASEAAGTGAGPAPVLRLGLRVEQRGDLRQLARTLQGRLRQASSDLQARFLQNSLPNLSSCMRLQDAGRITRSVIDFHNYSGS